MHTTNPHLLVLKNVTSVWVPIRYIVNSPFIPVTFVGYILRVENDYLTFDICISCFYENLEKIHLHTDKNHLMLYSHSQIKNRQLQMFTTETKRVKVLLTTNLHPQMPKKNIVTHISELDNSKMRFMNANAKAT